MSVYPVPRCGPGWEANGVPLHERVPTVDEFGRPLSDFLMLLPGLRELGGPPLLRKVSVIGGVLRQFREVVFVDLNVPLNLLWVSVRARPGVILDISTTVKFHLPEALLVGHK